MGIEPADVAQEGALFEENIVVAITFLVLYKMSMTWFIEFVLVVYMVYDMEGIITNPSARECTIKPCSYRSTPSNYVHLLLSLDTSFLW